MEKQTQRISLSVESRLILVKANQGDECITKSNQVQASLRVILVFPRDLE